jgi:deoxyribonuclease-4
LDGDSIDKNCEDELKKISLLLGAHQSIAGGIHKAFERGDSLGCTTLQVFTKNANQWRAKPITPADAANYKLAESSSQIRPVIAHTSYLINLCGKDRELLDRSRESFIDELRRCHLLGIPYLNFHPGAHCGMGEPDGIKTIIESLNVAHAATPDLQVKSVIETTAGQGSSLGHTFEQVKQIMEGVDDRARMAVCMDTCHIFAAGYDIRTPDQYEKTLQAFDDIVGLKNLVAIHMNDSLKGLGARRDRHEHIGKGAIGLEGFKCFMQDPRLSEIPKILETPKDDDLEFDRMNLKTLRELVD